MKFYILDDGTYVRTQTEVPKGQPLKQVDIDVSSKALCEFLNALILVERAAAPIEEPTPVKVPAPAPVTWESKRQAEKQHRFELFDAIVNSSESEIQSIILFSIQCGIEHAAKHQRRATDFVAALHEATQNEHPTPHPTSQS